MSTTPTPENDFNLDLHFLPAWAQQSPDINRYAHFKGDEGEGHGGRRRPRREGGGGRDGGGSGSGFRSREGGGRPAGAPGSGGGPGGGPGGFRGRGGPRREGGPGGPGGPGGGGGDRGRRPGGPQRGGFARGDDRGRRPEPVVPQLELNTQVMPDDKGVDSLSRQIKMSGRAYPLFEIAQMVLRKPERHHVVLTVKKKSDGTPIQPLFVCALDESVWLSQEDVVKHILDHHFATFYQVEKVPTEPPKGTYTFVGQCGISGVVLGPPNHHDYQNQLRRLHAERFSRMPFETFKSRVKIVRDEAVVKKWVEDQSFKSEYVCLNVAEPLKLSSREEVEKHFVQVHAPTLIRQVDTLKLDSAAIRNLKVGGLQRLVRFAFETQRKFPLQVATILSQQFASRGLQFFKVNKTVTHVAVARPHFLDLETNVVSDGVKNIVQYIDGHVGCTRRQLFEALVPSAKGSEAAATAVQSMTENATAPAEGSEASATTEAAPAAAAEMPAAAAPAEKPAFSKDASQFISDLHWLIHQGHVIEFANGVMETAKKPVPKPVRPPAPKAAAAATATSTAAAAAPAAAAVAATAESSEPSESSLQAEAEAHSAAQAAEEGEGEGEGEGESQGQSNPA